MQEGRETKKEIVWLVGSYPRKLPIRSLWKKHLLGLTARNFAPQKHVRLINVYLIGCLLALTLTCWRRYQARQFIRLKYFHLLGWKCGIWADRPYIELPRVCWISGGDEGQLKRIGVCGGLEITGSFRGVLIHHCCDVYCICSRKVSKSPTTRILCIM